ncbi:hypothetical protein CCM_07515 [Cordyceps militaris CM01]|uniref:Uncharacterized protein n=1 Tax=Cordyceps militaris (strain CM01) TaxID=983644 RepID=G3JQ12_CORMM|nr:uncharacterized protein CCM_07515 [Cordyceps militaris CM01]EGX89263.1 hypothetical protein CCM_07515 [Cordyceps militaris CM01]
MLHEGFIFGQLIEKAQMASIVASTGEDRQTALNPAKRSKNTYTDHVERMM